MPRPRAWIRPSSAGSTSSTSRATIRRKSPRTWSGTCASTATTWRTGPAPADIVVALRDRVQTLKDMAERAAVWFQPLDALRRSRRRQAPHRRRAGAAGRCARAPGEAAVVDARNRCRAALHDTAEALGIGMGKVAQPLRVAITGTQVSPDISHTVYLAGQGEGVARIDAALAKLPVGTPKSPGSMAHTHACTDPQAPRPRRRRLRARGGARVRGARPAPDADPRASAAPDRRSREAGQGLRPARPDEGHA